MGLDNGLYFVNTKEKQFRQDHKIEIGVAHKLFKANFPHDEFVNSDFIENYRFEIAYWRKCWNVREIFIRVAKKAGITGAGGLDVYDWSVSRDDLKEIVRQLKVLNESVIQEEDCDPEGTIWEQDVFLSINRNNINCLNWAIEMMRIHPELECRFYDSY